MRYGPVRRVARHEKLHRKVRSYFSPFTLYFVYAFFAAELDQRKIPSNYFVRDAVDLYLLWMVEYPDHRTIHERWGVPISVFTSIVSLLSPFSSPLVDEWVTQGTLGM